MKELVRSCLAQGTKPAIRQSPGGRDIKMPGRSPLQLLLIQTQDPPPDARPPSARVQADATSISAGRGSRILAQSPKGVGATRHQDGRAARHQDARVSALNLLQGAIYYVLEERTRCEHDIDRWVSLVEAGNILARAARTIQRKS